MERKNKSFAESFRHAFEGFKEGIKNERNMKIHLAMTVLVVFCSVVFGLTPVEKAIVYVLCGTVIAAELFNTAIENTVDIASPSFNIYAKKAKDTAAAAVLVLSITAAVVGCIIFLPYAFQIIGKIQKLI